MTFKICTVEHQITHQVKLAIHLVVVEVITRQENNQLTTHISILKYG